MKNKQKILNIQGLEILELMIRFPKEGMRLDGWWELKEINKFMEIIIIQLLYLEIIDDQEVWLLFRGTNELIIIADMGLKILMLLKCSLLIFLMNHWI